MIRTFLRRAASGRALGDALRCRGGGVAVFFALAALPVVAAAGAAIDLGRVQLEKQRLAAALDAAGLAAGGSQGDDAQLAARFNAFFAANFRDDGVASLKAPVTFAVDHERNVVTATATLSIGTAFLRVAGIDTVEVAASTEVNRQTIGLELAMVLDNTGSMLSNNNIQAVRDAAGQVIDILFGAGETNPNLKISVVPYVTAVNVGDIAPTIVSGTGAAYSATDATKWKGCVAERDYPDDVRDTPPSSGHMWTRYWWASAADNQWPPISTIFNNASTCNESTGPNLACPTPITPLTSAKTPLKTAVSQMQAWCRSGTISHVGMAWGWRTLSPEAPFSEGLPYGTKNWKKAAILMTDGNNDIYKKPDNKTKKFVNPFKSDYTSFGRLDDNRLGTTSISTAKTILDSRLSEVCTNMKAVGITVYTVTFTGTANEATRSIFRNCATDPSKYFDAPTQDELKTAFQTIATELSNLRISR